MAYYCKCAPNSVVGRPSLGNTVERAHSHIPVLKNTSPPFPRLAQLGVFPLGVDDISPQTPTLPDPLHHSHTQALDHEIPPPASPPTPDPPHTVMQEKKIRRKRRKPHGNKGCIPWNKGITHTPETRALISQRTMAALKDPKVRKKMSEHGMPHSKESKAKISSSLKRLWRERLKQKRMREKIFFSWAESLANAAKLLLPSELTLKQKLAKIPRKKKSKSVKLTSEGALRISSSPAWKELDLDIIEREKVHRAVSFADQIHAARRKRSAAKGD
ncbi:hypothetical protein Tsubulata_029875 [Turnera subulata]|uniref:Nuclease associated modular domain-containing protein n=1 Tax=Turnera subulata TaxID=218843 RepID=A0A9Q0FNL1_9ROSI|nr:hypothetical protein Tsubulata_029875 [Turnera subulata]